MDLLLKDDRILKFPKTKIMGILNTTPDSFYSESRLPDLKKAMIKAEKMISDGAEILDIGGESTRPGSDPVTPEEEAERVIPLIKGIRERFPEILISVDTYHASTAKKAFENGADILNDISALKGDAEMVAVAASYHVPVILMHMRGVPKHMQENPHYDDVVEEVKEFFAERIGFALAMGIKRERLILDPGIGFGKTLEHNLELIRCIDSFKEFRLPILLAGSRKTFIGEVLGGIKAEDRLEGTMALSSFAAMHDIEMVRVHDVKENLRIVRMTEAFK